MTAEEEIIYEENGAKVYEARYRTIKERVSPPTARDAAKSMSVFEIRRGLRGTWPKVPLILAGFIIFGFLVQMDLFLQEDGETFWLGSDSNQEEGPDQQGPIGILAIAGSLLTPMDGPGAIMILHIAIISAGLISGDLRDRAIDLYYSKITVRSYFLSKIIASFVLTFIGLPLFAVIYFFIAIYKRISLIEDYGVEFSAMFEVFWKMSVTILVVVTFLSILVLVFSAYTSNPINAGVGFLVFTLVSRVFFEAILYNATNIDLFYALSPISALDVLRRAIMQPDEISGQFWELSILSYFLYVGISIVLVWYKLQREKNQ